MTDLWARADDVLNSRPGRVLQVLASMAAVIVLTVVAVQLTSTRGCISRYAAASARTTAARAEAAAEDRRADDADRLAAENERRAFLHLLTTFQSPDRQAQQAAFANLTAVYQQGDIARAATAKTRADNNRKRAANPIPDPSLQCA